MATANRYSLVHVSLDGTVTPFATVSNVNGKTVEREKFPLSQIDAFTTRLGGVDSLYLLFNYMYKRRFEDGKFYIQYRQGMQNKRIRVAYSDDDNLKEISNNNIGCSYVKRDIDFETYVTNFLYDLRSDSGLYRFLSKSEENYLNSYLLGQIDRYFISLDNDMQENVDFYFRKICETISSYKIIRNIEDGRKKYKEKTVVKCDESPFTGKTLTYSMDEDGQGRLF